MTLSRCAPAGARSGTRKTKRVIDISAVVNDHYMHQAGLNLVADTGATLEAIAKGNPAVQDMAGRRTGTRSRLHWRKPSRQMKIGDRPPIIAETRAVLPPETLATADSGAHRILLSQMWECSEERGLIQSSALCTMGCAVPMAIGLKLAEPDRP